MQSNSVKPNSISRLQIRRQHILSRGIKFGNTKLYLGKSNSERLNSILSHQIQRYQILSYDIKFGKTKFYSVTSNSVIPNFILRRQIRKDQILSRDIKFGNANSIKQILSLRTQKRKSCNFKSWYPVRSSEKAWLKCTEDNLFLA